MTKLFVVTHKEYGMPDSPLYIPIMAGSVSCEYVSEIYTRDDSGDNISDRNNTFSELTALYWIWKNHLDKHPEADKIGLCHYRRLFAVKDGGHRRILNESDADSLMSSDIIVLPKVRNYLFETNYSHYANAHNAADLHLTREIIAEKYQDYLNAYDKRMARKKGHRFNMFIMPKDLLDEYCVWLFDILFELERILDTSEYRGRDKRVFGLVAERLLDVWIDANGRTYKELPYIMTEKESYLLKGAALLLRKIKGIIRDIKGKIPQ